MTHQLHEPRPQRRICGMLCFIRLTGDQQEIQGKETVEYKIKAVAILQCEEEGNQTLK